MKIRILFSVLILISVPLASQETQTIVVASVLVDPSIAAPTVELRAPNYRIGVAGWTAYADMTRSVSERTSVILLLDATPTNAHNSNRIFMNGQRERTLEFDSASYRVRGGIRQTWSPRSESDILVVGLYESIEGAAVAPIAAYWEKPYTGVELIHRYSSITSSNPLVGSFEGIEYTARAEMFTGETNWQRLSVEQRAGKSFGKVHLRESVTILHGDSLNVVNRFLAGGSWDILGGTALYGYRYGEFRVERGVIANAGIDYRVAGNWQAGLRASHLSSDVEDTWGYAVTASTTWKTFGVSLGLGVPERSNSDPVFSIALVAPLYRK
jgi:hypothetical protein